MVDTFNIGLVGTPESVAQLSRKVARAERVAIDTEADSLHHYYEKVCLIQISLGGEDFIIDPLAGADLAPLITALKKCPLLLLHGADYDLRMLKRDFAFEARAMFDTMSAAQLLGYERFSYAALVEKHLGVVLDKHGQKADWSRRPLSDKLLKYAAGDTHYLAQIADILREEMIAAGRLHWHEEVCARLLPEVADGIRPPDLDRQWRVKGWHTLRSTRAQGILRELWRWRDLEAQRVDLPPFKIIRNETLVALAGWAAAGSDEEAKPALPRTFVGRRLRLLNDAVTRALQMPEKELPGPLSSPRRETPPADEQMVAALKVVRDQKAAELKLDPGVLLPGAMLTAIATARPHTLEELESAGELYRWQTELLGAELLPVVDKHRANVAVAGRRGQRRPRKAVVEEAENSGGAELNGSRNPDRDTEPEVTALPPAKESGT